MCATPGSSALTYRKHDSVVVEVVEVIRELVATCIEHCLGADVPVGDRNTGKGGRGDWKRAHRKGYRGAWETTKQCEAHIHTSL